MRSAGSEAECHRPGAVVILFAFGTLKRGFPLYDRGLSRATYLGKAKTVERYPMLIAGPWYAPMMLNQPGVGFRVHGELFEVDERSAAVLDSLESVGKPGNYRVLVPVIGERAGGPIHAQAYMKAAALADPAHSAFLQEYVDRRFIPPWKRSHSTNE